MGNDSCLVPHTSCLFLQLRRNLPAALERRLDMADRGEDALVVLRQAFDHLDVGLNAHQNVVELMGDLARVHGSGGAGSPGWRSGRGAEAGATLARSERGARDGGRDTDRLRVLEICVD